jgi:hypothetical protein
VHEFKPNREIDPSFIALPGTLFTIDGARAAHDQIWVPNTAVSAPGDALLFN